MFLIQVWTSCQGNADKWAAINLWSYPLSGGFGIRRSQIPPNRLLGLLRDYIGDFSHCHFFILVERQDINQGFKIHMNQALRISLCKSRFPLLEVDLLSPKGSKYCLPLCLSLIQKKSVVRIRGWEEARLRAQPVAA